jgi:hypothetical protein
VVAVLYLSVPDLTPHLCCVHADANEHDLLPPVTPLLVPVGQDRCMGT